MTLDLAIRILEAARTAAEARGLKMALAVVDAAGVPVALHRMDGASLVAANTVVAKARTAVHFGRPTAAVLESARRNPEVYGSFLSASDERLVLSMGGIPIVDANGVIGAVAASGGTGTEDVEIASAAAKVAR
jgi:uncharacterized protein GlcG (DUF336 family)